MASSRTKLEISQTRIIKRLRANLEDAKNSAKFWEEQHQKVYQERNSYRAWVAARYRWWTHLIAKDQKPSLTWLLNSCHELFAKHENFTVWIKE